MIKASEVEVLNAKVARESRNPRSNLHNSFVTLTGEIIEREPEPHDCLLGCFPVGASSAVVSMGGVGKSQWIVYKAIEAVVERGEDVVICSAEDNHKDYQAKLHNALFRGHEDFGVDFDRKRIYSKIHVLNLKGIGLQFLKGNGRSYELGPALQMIGDLINSQCKKVSLVVFETLSRLVGEESVEAISPFVTGTDYLAEELSCASLIVHHTGKAQGRAGTIDLYSGRGSSSLGDNTRSFFVLTPVDEINKAAILDELMPIDRRRGKYFKVTHVRNSFRKELPDDYFRVVSGINGPYLRRVGMAEGQEADELKAENLKAQLLNYIELQGGEIPKTELLKGKARDCPGNHESNARALDQLESEQKIAIESRRKEGASGAGKHWVRLLQS